MNPSLESEQEYSRQGKYGFKRQDTEEDEPKNETPPNYCNWKESE